jgi:3'-5' exonuclease
MANQNSYNPEHLLVLDIETVPQYASFGERCRNCGKFSGQTKFPKPCQKIFHPEMYHAKGWNSWLNLEKSFASAPAFFTRISRRLCFRIKSYQHPDE